MNKTTEALKLAEEALSIWVVDEGYDRDAIALAAVREALAEPEITTPDVCGEVCARAKLCYGCGKALDEANAKLAEPVKQEPVAYQSKMSGVLRYGKHDDSDVPLYAAPIDAKAIRAEALKESARFAYYVRKEALEEAAKWLKESGLIGSNDCAAAIRGLK